MVAKQIAGKGVWVNRWIVESETSDRQYTVGQKEDGSFGCDCPAWKFKKAPRPDCKHIIGLKATEPVDMSRTQINWGDAHVRTATSITQQRDNARRVVTYAEAAAKATPNQPIFLLQTRRSIKLQD